jgi:hypothetical protein
VVQILSGRKQLIEIKSSNSIQISYSNWGLLYTADLPTTNNTTIATFADDTTLLATNSDPALASQQLQNYIDLLQE